MSTGVFSSFLPAEVLMFGKSSSSATVRFVPSNRRVAIFSASKPAATETKKREPRGIMKPRRVSPEMQAFLGGVSEIPRTQALKEIWAHIKLHNLQVYVYPETLGVGDFCAGIYVVFLNHFGTYLRFYWRFIY